MVIGRADDDVSDGRSSADSPAGERRRLNSAGDR
jgi:hypothetical protein